MSTVLFLRTSPAAAKAAKAISRGRTRSGPGHIHIQWRGPVAVEVIRCMAKDSESGRGKGSSSFLETAAVVGGLVAAPVIGWSLYTLKTTGCGLPPGPGGSFGALEGVSYLLVLAIVSWSAYTKVKTGSGLPNGPFGLLGAVEGVSYLAFLAILLVFGLQFLDKGFIPGPLPGEECFG